MPYRIGVLALQGDFKEHIQCLNQLKVYTEEIRTPEQVKKLDGLIIPGGESTTISKLIKIFNFEKVIYDHALEKKALWGTCAGMIILAKTLTEINPKPLGLLDIKVSRNWYGRQIDSFEKDINIVRLNKPFRAVFIRAPVIQKVGKNVRILGEENGYPIAVRSDNILATSFHPELTGDLRIHDMFVNMIDEKYIKK